jgi:hypothetical protein
VVIKDAAENPTIERQQSSKNCSEDVAPALYSKKKH